MLRPAPVLANLEPVVAPQHDGRVFPEPVLREGVQNPPHLCVYVADRRAAPADEGNRGGSGHGPLCWNVGVVAELAVAGEGPSRGVPGRGVVGRELHLVARVVVPVLLRGIEGEMGLLEADREKERPGSLLQAAELLDRA